MKYLDTKKSSLEDSVIRVMMGEKKLDPVNPDAVKKKFDDRKDKAIDNDGDVDSTDKYLHKRRKAISKAVKKDEAYGGVAGMASYDPTLPKKKKNGNVRENVKDIAMMMRDKKYKGRTSAFDAAVKKKYPKEYDTNAVQDLIKRHAEMNESIKNEGTWAMPDTPKLKMGLKKALQRPIMLGKEGDDATDTIRSFIGDDELYDDLYAAGMKNPKGDARPIIKAAMKRLGIKEDVELDENLKSIEKMMKDRKYKGKTSAFDAAVKKMFPKEYEKDDVQDLIKKHAETNEQSLDENFRKLAMMGIGTETKKGAKVGQSMDYYLPKTGDKSTGKIIRVSKDGYEIENDGDLTPRLKGKRHKFKFYDPTSDKTSVRGMRKENYEIGNDYAKHTLRVTPGQLESDVDDMLGIAQKKNLSMRETLAKMWGMTESKNPFEKKVNEKEHEMVNKVVKTMTGKKPTPIEVNPKTGD